MVEANVKDVKLTVLDILGQVSLGFDFRPGVGKELLVSPTGFFPDDQDFDFQRALIIHNISTLGGFLGVL